MRVEFRAFFLRGPLDLSTAPGSTLMSLFSMMSTRETLTEASPKEVLDQIGTACLMALDPCLTREQLAQRVKDIYKMADLRGDGMDLDDDDGAEKTLDSFWVRPRLALQSAGPPAAAVSPRHWACLPSASSVALSLGLVEFVLLFVDLRNPRRELIDLFLVLRGDRETLGSCSRAGLPHWRFPRKKSPGPRPLGKSVRSVSRTDHQFLPRVALKSLVARNAGPP